MDVPSRPSALPSQHDQGDNVSYTQSRRLLDLENDHNATPHIHRLPPELLIRVFEILESLISIVPQYIRNQDLSSLWVYPGYPPIYAWISCTHVCRRWRHTVLAAPTLWRRVIPFVPEWTREMIRRAADIPLCISLLPYQYTPPISSESYQILLNHIPRAGQLLMFDSDFLPTCESYAAPFLHTLNVSGSPSPAAHEQLLARMSKSPDASLLFTKDGLSSLTHLVIETTTPLLLWHLLRPTLQHLRADYLNPIPSLSAWISALVDLPNLRSLSLPTLWLDRDTKHIPMWGPAGMDAPPKITMQHLAELTLRDYSGGASISAFCSRLILPKLENITLLVDIGRKENFRHILPLLHDTIPIHVSGCRYESLDTRLIVSERVDTATLVGVGGAPATRTATIHISGYIDKDDRRNLFASLPHIRTFKLAGEGRFILPFVESLAPPGLDDSKQDAPLFTALPQLEHLTLQNIYLHGYSKEEYELHPYLWKRARDTVDRVEDILRRRRDGGWGDCNLELQHELRNFVDSGRERYLQSPDHDDAELSD